MTPEVVVSAPNSRSKDPVFRSGVRRTNHYLWHNTIEIFFNQVKLVMWNINEIKVNYSFCVKPYLGNPVVELEGSTAVQAVVWAGARAVPVEVDGGIHYPRALLTGL